MKTEKESMRSTLDTILAKVAVMGVITDHADAGGFSSMAMVVLILMKNGIIG